MEAFPGVVATAEAVVLAEAGSRLLGDACSESPQAPEGAASCGSAAFHSSRAVLALGAESMAGVGERFVYECAAADDRAVGEVADPAAQHS